MWLYFVQTLFRVRAALVACAFGRTKFNEITKQHRQWMDGMQNAIRFSLGGQSAPPRNAIEK